MESVILDGFWPEYVGECNVLASWLVPAVSFLEIRSSETVAEVSPYDVVPPLCGSVFSIPSSMGLLGTKAASSSIVFIFLVLELFLLVAQATIFLFIRFLLESFLLFY